MRDKSNHWIVSGEGADSKKIICLETGMVIDAWASKDSHILVESKILGPDHYVLRANEKILFRVSDDFQNAEELEKARKQVENVLESIAEYVEAKSAEILF